MHVYVINTNAFYLPQLFFIENSADPDKMHHFGFSLLGKYAKWASCFNYQENVYVVFIGI